MLKNDPEYKKAMASRKMKLMLGLGAVSAVAGIVATAGAAGLVGSGVATAAAAIAKGAVIARLGTNVVSTMNNKNLSLGKRMLLVAPLIMSIAFTAGVKLPIPDKPQEPSAADNEKFIAEGETNAPEGADDSTTSDESRTLSNDEYYGGNAGPQNTPSDSTDDLDGNDISGDSSSSSFSDSSGDSSGDDSGNEIVDSNFKNIPGSNPDQQITGSAIKELDPKMQCKNSIRDVAKAEEGMWLQRKDGTYWKLTRGDIKWAQDHLPPKDAETVSVEKAEEVVVDPHSDENLAHTMKLDGDTASSDSSMQSGDSEVSDDAVTTDSDSYKRMVADTENLESFKVGNYDVVVEKADKFANRDPGYILYKDGKLFKTGSVTEDDPVINRLLDARKDS